MPRTRWDSRAQILFISNVIVDVEVMLHRSLPRIVGVHAVEHQLPEMIRKPIEASNRAPQRRLNAGVVRLMEHVTIPLVERTVRIIFVEDRIGQSAYGA